MRGVLLLVLLLGCDRPPVPAGPTILRTDARGKRVAVPVSPRRIVSLAPSTTELLFAVGAGGQVAGVTTYCDWPPEAAAKPKVGNIVLDYEKIAALDPDLILSAGTLNQQGTQTLEGKGFPVFAVDPGTFEEIGQALELVGEMTGHPREGSRAAEALRARVRAVVPGPGPSFYFEYSADPLGTTGPDTYLGRALALAGGKNVFEGAWRNRIDWETVLQRDPEVLLIAHDRREGLERRAGWKELRAVKAGRVYFVAKDHYVYPTPRLAEGLEEAARLFREARK